MSDSIAWSALMLDLERVTRERDEACMRLSDGVSAERARCLAAIPTSWLDALYTGPEGVLRQQQPGGGYSGPQVEKLIFALRERIANPEAQK